MKNVVHKTQLKSSYMHDLLVFLIYFLITKSMILPAFAASLLTGQV